MSEHYTQVASIQEVSEIVAQLVRMGGSGEAVWHFDQVWGGGGPGSRHDAIYCDFLG